MNRKSVDGIRHVTSEESNIFSELGFDDADAEQLRGQAEKEVEHFAPTHFRCGQSENQ